MAVDKLALRPGMECQILSSSSILKGQVGRIYEVLRDSVVIDVPGFGNGNEVKLSSVLVWANNRWEQIK